MRITISGLPGAGKTTLGEMLAKEYKMPFLSIGDLRGEFAVKNNWTIEELNERRRLGENVDEQFDEFQKKWMQENENFVVEGRLSFYFAPKNTHNIFLAVDELIGAQRIMNAQRTDEKQYTTIKERILASRERIQSDIFIYKKLYNINPYDMMNYDSVIFTSILNPKSTLDITKKILSGHK